MQVARVILWCSSFVRLINHQIEDNKKYEVAVADDSAATCSPEGGAQITCAETHKCCTSKRSYLAGTAHESQPRLALYAICCPLDTHCKFDTIFVSCAPGAGPDDYSGVIAGLQYNQNEKAEMNQDAVALLCLNRGIYICVLVRVLNVSLGCLCCFLRGLFRLFGLGCLGPIGRVSRRVEYSTSLRCLVWFANVLYLFVRKAGQENSAGKIQLLSNMQWQLQKCVAWYDRCTLAILNFDVDSNSIETPAKWKANAGCTCYFVVFVVR